MTVIAIDGTFASGKGTLGKRLADHYGLAYLDTGKLYRAVGYGVMQAGDDPENAAHAAKAAKAITGNDCLLYTSPSPRDRTRSRMPSSA